MRTIFFLVFCTGLLPACKKTFDPDYPLSAKAEAFETYTRALDRCKHLPADSILICAQDSVDIMAIKDIRQDVWLAYGRAKALFHNGLGMEAVAVIDEILPETEVPGLLFERAELLQLRSALRTDSFSMHLAAQDSYRAADIYLQLGLVRKVSACYLAIANLQYNTANYPIAIEDARRAAAIFQRLTPMEHEDSVQLMHAYNTTGLAYYRLHRHDSAVKYYDLSRNMAVLLHDEFWNALVKGNLAEIYRQKGMVKEAIENYAYDIRTSLKHNDPASAALSLLSIGEIYVSNSRPDTARQYYDSAYVLLLRSGRPISLSKYYNLMSEWFALKHDYSRAFGYYKKHIEFRDSVQSIQLNSQLQQAQNQKQFEKQLADINLLRAENELKKKELLVSRISIAAFILGLGLLSGLLYVIRKNYKQLRELNIVLEDRVKVRTDRLRKINSELDTYLYRASHDVRRPILTILGLVQVAYLAASEDERYTIFSAIKKTASEMDKMLRKLRMAYELEKEKKRSRNAVCINSYIADKIAELNKEYPYATFEVVEDDNIIIETDINLIDIILANILENACIFSVDDHSRVTVTIVQREGSVHIAVQDDGIGIDPAFIENIFDPYMRFSNKSTGSGLGLYLAMKAVRMIGGDLAVNSAPNEGSEFRVLIPVHSVAGREE